MYDITDKIGQLRFLGEDTRKPEWLMYSFDRPAYTLWNAVAEELYEIGWTELEIKEWLQSKLPRWELDGILGERLVEIGKDVAHRAEKVSDK